MIGRRRTKAQERRSERHPVQNPVPPYRKPQSTSSLFTCTLTARHISHSDLRPRFRRSKAVRKRILEPEPTCHYDTILFAGRAVKKCQRYAMKLQHGLCPIKSLRRHSKPRCAPTWVFLNWLLEHTGQGASAVSNLAAHGVIFTRHEGKTMCYLRFW